jgi:hypothetical protein
MGSINEILVFTFLFINTTIYDSMSVKPPRTFILRDKEQHKERYRLLSHAFSQSNLYKAEPLITE